MIFLDTTPLNHELGFFGQETTPPWREDRSGVWRRIGGVLDVFVNDGRAIKLENLTLELGGEKLKASNLGKTLHCQQPIL